MNKYTIIPTVIVTLIIALSGCSKFENAFNDTGLAPLPGKRISVLEQNSSALIPNKEAAAEAVRLPAAWNNHFWPQTGGYPNHAMGQLELGSDLKFVWKKYIKSYATRGNPLISQPIVAKNTVFALNNKAELLAFDLKTGKSKWWVSTKSPDENGLGAIGGGIAYAQGKIYVTNGYKQLVCINPENGSVIWRATLTAPARSAPTASGDKIYIITLNNQLLTFSAADGELLWSYTGIASSTNLLGSISPAVNQNIVVLPLSSGEIIGLRPENGKVVWGDNISAIKRTGTIFSIPDIRGQPVLDQGIVIASSYSGRLVAIDEITGKRVWQKPIGSAEMAWSADNTIYVVNNEQKIIALSRKNGNIRWVTVLPRKGNKKKNRPIWTGPILAGGRLITANNKGRIVEVNPIDGKIIKYTKTYGGEGVSIPPIVANNTLLLLTEEGNIQAYR